MKSLIRIVFCIQAVIVSSLELNAQAEVNWKGCWGGNFLDYPQSIQSCSDGGYIIAGVSSSNNADITESFGGSDAWILKLDSSGNLQWQKNFGGNNEDEATSIVELSNSNIVFAGFSSSSNNSSEISFGGYDFWIVMLSSDGTLIWEKKIGGANNEYAYSILESNDGSLLIGGQSDSDSILDLNNGGSNDGCLMSLSMSGDLNWFSFLGSGDFESISSICQLENSDFIAVGRKGAMDFETDVWVVRFNSDGQVVSESQWGGTGYDGATSVVKQNMGYLVAGFSNSTDGDIDSMNGEYDAWVLSFSGQDSILWNQTYGGFNVDWVYSVVGDLGGDFLLTGTSNSDGGTIGSNNGLTDIWLFKINSLGEILWSTLLGGSDFETAYSIALGDNGKLVIAAQTSSMDGDIAGLRNLPPLYEGIADYFVSELVDCALGCMNPTACNYNPNATCDDNSCVFPGCNDTNACNFTPDAGCDNGSCLYVNAGCNDSNAFTYNDLVDDACNCIGTNFNYGILAGQFQDGCCNLPMCLSNIPTMTLLPPLNVSQYQIQWYYKEGGSPWNCDQSSYTSWNLIEGATSMSYTPIEFYGTRSFRCLVTPSAEYNLNPAWAQGCGVLTAFNFSSQPIIGNPNITPFSTVTYAVNPIAGNTFNWTVTNGVIVSGQGTSVIQVLWGQNGPYQVSLSEGNGVCGDISNLIVVNSDCSLSAAITSTNGNAFCPGGTNELIASSNGTNLSYTWYLDGVEISGATEQSFGITSAGNYQVMVNDGLCSAVSQILNISQLPGVQWPEITVMEQNADCASASATITAAGGNATSYAWSSGETTPEITVTASGEYVLTVTNDGGCSAVLPTVVINFAQSEAVPVCLVTVDPTTGHNVIVWEPVTSEVTNAYVVYKETNVADVYEPIGTVLYGSDGIFEDVNSNSAVQASRYKLALIDTCDIESSLSDLHKTIHLTSNLGVGNTVNLIWSHYEGFAFGSYTIYRGTTPDDMAVLATIASNLNSYTDLLPLTNGYYMIEVEGVSCDPSRSVQTSKSNIINYEFVGVDEQMASQIKIYPNPATDRLTLQCAGGMRGATYDMYDATGRVVLTGPVTATTVDIDVRLLQAGLYVMRVNQSTLHWVKH